MDSEDTNPRFSPPGLLGKASISIGPKVDAATGLTTGMPDQAPLLEETWKENKYKIIKKNINIRITLWTPLV